MHVREIFAGFKAYGAVAFKDQSAYTRSLDYGNPSHAEAEAVFNWFMADATRSAAYPDGVKPLDDYLFHAFLRMARDLDLPVQLHTGHLAGLYGDITKANAVQLADLFLLHRDVRFDLFHANWPYGGEALFLVKNFPNVSLNFCWAHTIDPLYCQRPPAPGPFQRSAQQDPRLRLGLRRLRLSARRRLRGPRVGAGADRAGEHRHRAGRHGGRGVCRLGRGHGCGACVALRQPERFLPPGPGRGRIMIISASRRTDIPAFYSDWFMHRVRAGFCTVPNPFNAVQVSTVSLLPRTWTPSSSGRATRAPCCAISMSWTSGDTTISFEMTLLDYPRWLETNTPPVDAAIAVFRAVAEHVGPARIIWRYDPLVFTRTHRRRLSPAEVRRTRCRHCADTPSAS